MTATFGPGGHVFLSWPLRSGLFRGGTGSASTRWHRLYAQWDSALLVERTGPMDVVFSSHVIEWRGPSPFYFVPVPEEQSADIREVASMATYGWGVVPVEARIGEIAFATSLFPKDGEYLLPIKQAVRKPQGLSTGDEVTVEMTVRL
ncbi:hypothetical protein SAVERM_637 [Streptomyces avermitilis MA-4680 = NBRC 14893]|uniref:DUF1905 domain-containing protein n=2 Tax=Streptomyces avermitilis TaxID=33903 RepID=Q82Q83_STRAW|nr:hypothetical protein SAVERM_637 [Streptomyces avermitilis MA-4680 = NBRC 14893]